MKSKLTIIIMVLFFSLPVFVFAQWQPGQPIVNCEKDCGWPQFIELINRVIKFMLYLATLLAIIAFIWAGFQLMTSGGNESKAKEAKELFFKVVIGLVFAYGAWILVDFILDVLGADSGARQLIGN